MAKVTGILGKKVGMTQLFDSKGDVHPGDRAAGGAVRDHAAQDATKDGYDAGADRTG